MLNLDQLVPTDKKVQLNGEILVIPGEVPVRYMLRLINITKKLEDDSSNLELNDEVLDLLFEILDLKKENSGKLSSNFRDETTLSQATMLTRFLFNPDIGEDDNDEDDSKKNTQRRSCDDNVKSEKK